jgi:HKD family nuclease
MDKIQSLNLSGLTGSFLSTLEEWEVEIDQSDKGEMIENILKDFEESGYAWDES